ncbi:chloride channel protein [Castellaniella sp. MT123]|uniref:chloride channel protein n=1 Tax=Castellaniella sp. MT123 TaxID=3140381 RepID=UPI0031F3E977
MSEPSSSIVDSSASRLQEQSQSGGLPVAPDLGLSLVQVRMPRDVTRFDWRLLRVIAVSVALGFVAALVAWALMLLIGLITNLSFYGVWSTAFSSPAGAVPRLGAWVIAVPVVGGLIAGGMARWGSKAIRGHGIPEAMEQVLLNESRIPTRITLLKPLSSAVVIGTGGPFGAEGPIIATGGALGSLIGQLMKVTASERKVLLAAGAAAGMAAVFAAPISAVTLAVELLLFELRGRSLIPVALACVTATGMRDLLMGSTPVFLMDTVTTPGGGALAAYVLIGALIGVISVAVTHLVYAIEDGFERLPVHWMWWPALGAVVVGVVGWVAPLTLGVGYTNIEDILNGRLAMGALAWLCVMKFISWSICLGSGTSGGTLAPLFTIGGALGAMLGLLLAHAMPWLGIDPRIAALIGMAALFAGASRALLTTVIFALETTGQPAGLLPLLGACTAAYLISVMMMRNTIMTEKIARRGVRVPSEYKEDYLERILVGAACARDVATLRAGQTIGEIRRWIAQGGKGTQHQGYPVLDAQDRVLGILTRRTFFDAQWSDQARLGDLIHRPPVVITPDHTLRQAADHMAIENVGRLLVVDADDPTRMLGILTRGDVIAAHTRRIRENARVRREISLHTWRRMRARRRRARG